MMSISFTNWFSDFGFIINSPLSSLPAKVGTRKKRGVYGKIRKPIKIVHTCKSDLFLADVL